MTEDGLQIEDVEISLDEATETLRAIRSGLVDAVIVAGPNGHGVVTFRDPDHAYRALVEAMGEGAALVTRGGAVCYCNSRFAVLTGESAADGVVGRDFRDLMPSDAAIAIDAMLERALRGPVRIEVSLVLRDGGTRTLQLTASATSVGEVDVFCIVATDLGEQRAQTELYREALIGMEARERLISIAGHELRTPIQVLVSEIAVLRAQPTAATDDQLESIQRVGSQLASLVGTLLDVRLLGSDEVELSIEDVDLSELVRAVIARPNDLVPRPRVDVDARPIRGRWDRLRLEQVVTNLLSNAAKYGLGKPVRVVVDGDDKVARLLVEDRGIGVASEQIAHLFKPFARIGSVKTATGLGLGLYITAQIVKAHRGTVRVESTPNVGSRFVVELPYR